MAMLDVFDKPIRDWDSVAKRVFDLVFATFAIACLWPVMIGAAIAVKATSKGPVFFKQKRHGFNNEIIDVFKFRSMYTDMGDQSATKAVTKGDPRVTPVGRFLRKSSIDELPQLFNVLKGDLSLVGPRRMRSPPAPMTGSTTQIVEGYFGRHRVKPGVTAGRRSMAGAARSTATRKLSSAPPMISITSRTGRCCSISRSCS